MSLLGTSLLLTGRPFVAGVDQGGHLEQRRGRFIWLGYKFSLLTSVEIAHLCFVISYSHAWLLKDYGVVLLLCCTINTWGNRNEKATLQLTTVVKNIYFKNFMIVK